MKAPGKMSIAMLVPTPLNMAAITRQHLKFQMLLVITAFLFLFNCCGQQTNNSEPGLSKLYQITKYAGQPSDQKSNVSWDNVSSHCFFQFADIVFIKNLQAIHPGKRKLVLDTNTIKKINKPGIFSPGQLLPVLILAENFLEKGAIPDGAFPKLMMVYKSFTTR